MFALAQWICLCFPSCCPGFESQVHHLRFYQFKFEFKLWHVEKTKINRKEAGIGPFLKYWLSQHFTEFAQSYPYPRKTIIRFKAQSSSSSVQWTFVESCIKSDKPSVHVRRSVIITSLLFCKIRRRCRRRRWCRHSFWSIAKCNKSLKWNITLHRECVLLGLNTVGTFDCSLDFRFNKHLNNPSVWP